MKIRHGYGFDDVLIEPVFSNISSRTEPDVSTIPVKNWAKFDHPIIPANMDCIATIKMANVWYESGGLFIHHRFQPLENVREYSYLTVGMRDYCGTVGQRRNWQNHIYDIANKNVHICIDIAHAHTNTVMEAIHFIKGEGLKLIVGNVATKEATRDLCNAGVDAIKVGIGPGLACLTRTVTGVGVPQITAIMDCSEEANKFHVPVIADGGIKSSAHVAKALAAGANSVMIGGLFSGSDEAGGRHYPLQITCPSSDPRLQEKPPKPTHKIYWGQSSYDFQMEHYNGLKEGVVPEGETLKVPISGPAINTLKTLLGGLKSSMSYLGAKTIPEFQSKANFITTNTIKG